MSDTDTTPDVAKLQEQIANLNKALASVREEAGGYKSQISAYEEAKAQQEREQAEAREEYKALYEKTSAERDALKAEYDSLKSAREARLERLKESNSERIEALPEADRALVPNLDPEAKSDWLSRFERRVAAEDSRPKGGRAGGGQAPDPDAIPEAIKAKVEAEASRHNRDPKAWYRAHKDRLHRKYASLLK